MKKNFTTICFLLIAACCSAQSVYNAASYAANGDTVYLTSAQPDTTNYYAGGADYTWNFGRLKGLSQQTLLFRNPKATGFTQLQWPYIYNTANVNLSSTNGQSVALGQLEETNNNDYYLQNGSMLAEKASSFAVAYGNVSINVKNTYTTADTIYKFPLEYTDTFASTASYTTTLPGVYYNTQTLNRTNTVDGWGTVTTPYGTFTHCLRMVSDVAQADTFAIYGLGLPNDTMQYREIKWLDSTKNYPVLYVKQALAGGVYITEQVQYYDKQQYFQPQAFFAYVPLLPVVNDTVTFQNLSTNSTAYIWNFGDGTTSDTANPQHVYTAAGTYSVQLIAYNGSLTDTFVLNIKVSGSTLPVQLVSFTGAREKNDNVLQWTTATETNTAYFTVQRSGDGVSFGNIANVIAAGNSTTLKNYRYNDTANAQGVIYYRLKIVGKDGNITYSGVLVLRGTATGGTLKLYPNPTIGNGNVTLAITSAEETNAIATVYNASGKQLLLMAMQLKGGNNNFEVPVNNLMPGVYFLVCRNADGSVADKITFSVIK